MRAVHCVSSVLTAAFILATAPAALAADGDDWIVGKSSGEVWLTGTGVHQASLKQEDLLKPGDTIRTGRTGRVLLKRGEETILISPNSVVGVPAQKKEGLSTTIVQQAGSILLEVEKRNVQHFEVETPYLAAVVKGTQFRVTIDAGKTSVDVIRGQVQVADFKTGQIAQVMAGQHATAFADGKNGLSLGGAGTLSPIEQGKPRAPSIERVPVQRAGLSAPRNASNGQSTQSSRHAGAHLARHGVTRISSPIGEVRLNMHRVTHGLARDKSVAHGGTRNAANKDTVWGSSGSGDNSAVANNGQGNGNNVAAGAGVSSTVAAISGSNGGGGNNNGNNGNHYGNDNGNGNGNTNSNGNGNGNGANGNGRGNGQANNGNGNGNGNGRNR
jgi:FecR protein